MGLHITSRIRTVLCWKQTISTTSVQVCPCRRRPVHVPRLGSNDHRKGDGSLNGPCVSKRLKISYVGKKIVCIDVGTCSSVKLKESWCQTLSPSQLRRPHSSPGSATLSMWILSLNKMHPSASHFELASLQKAGTSTMHK